MDSKSAVNFLAIAALELRGSIALSQQHWEEGGKLFAQAQNKESELGYNEPPRYFRPAQEMAGDAYLRARRWKDAEAAYQRALALRPHSGFALYGIAQAKAGAGDLAAARQSYAEFRTAWAHADTHLPQMQTAEAFLVQHSGTALSSAPLA